MDKPNIAEMIIQYEKTKDMNDTQFAFESHLSVERVHNLKSGDYEATAVVCMSAVCEKYEVRSTKSFLIAPLCGAVFVDIVAIPTIIFFITKFA